MGPQERNRAHLVASAIHGKRTLRGLFEPEKVEREAGKLKRRNWQKDKRETRSGSQTQRRRAPDNHEPINLLEDWGEEDGEEEERSDPAAPPAAAETGRDELREYLAAKRELRQQRGGGPAAVDGGA